MTKRRLLLTGLLCCTALLVGTWIYLTRDEAPPDVSDLMLQRRQVADNGFRFINFSAGDVVIPDDLIQESEPFDIQDPEAGVFLPWSLSKARKTLETNAHHLRAVDQALARQDLILPLQATLDEDVPYLIEVRNLSRLFVQHARVFVERDKGPEALETAMKMVMLGDRMERGQGMLREQLVALAVKNMGLKTIANVVAWADLDVKTLRACIAELDPYQTDPVRFEACLKAEFSVMATTAERAARMPTGGLLCRNATKRLIADGFRALIENVKRPHWERQEVEAYSIPFSDGGRRHPRHFYNIPGRLIFNVMVPPISDSLLTHDNAFVMFGGTRILLALRCHVLEHGELPESLGELLPHYLPALPLDPFDGKPLRYSKAERRIWCVGPDGRNDEPRGVNEIVVGGTPILEPGWVENPRRGYSLILDPSISGTPHFAAGRRAAE